MSFQIPDAAAHPGSADVKTARTDLGAVVLTPYAETSTPASQPLFLGITIIIALLAVLAIWAFMDASVLASSQRTRIDLPAANCPLPGPGKALAITVLPGTEANVYRTSCRLIAGRTL